MTFVTYWWVGGQGASVRSPFSRARRDAVGANTLAMEGAAARTGCRGQTRRIWSRTLRCRRAAALAIDEGRGGWPGVGFPDERKRTGVHRVAIRSSIDAPLVLGLPVDLDRSTVWFGRTWAFREFWPHRELHLTDADGHSTEISLRWWARPDRLIEVIAWQRSGNRLRKTAAPSRDCRSTTRHERADRAPGPERLCVGGDGGRCPATVTACPTSHDITSTVSTHPGG